MSAPHPATLPPEKLLAECDQRRLRRGGPGGQHRNKVETAVVLRHRPTGIDAEANERRSQAQNLRQATFRLRIRLAIEFRRPVADVANYQPTPLWQSRTIGRRINVNAEHDDFPALLAEALDVITATEFDLTTAAVPLAVTATQLWKLIQQEPTVATKMNDAREERGLRRLR
jgi:hypothetical protein